MAKKKHSKKPQRPVKKKARKRITGMPKKTRPRSRRRNTKIGSVTQHIAIARRGLEERLKDQMLRQYNATTKTAKRKIGKKIAELKSKIHKLK